MKSQGNSLFQSMDYQGAAEVYGRCLASLAGKDYAEGQEMQKLVLSNRS